MPPASSEDALCVRAISLRRRADRWSACWAHLSSTLPAHLLPRCRIFEGTDAAAAASGEGEAAVVSFEQLTSSGVYRGWPLVEVDDARRCFPSTPPDASDADAWLAYERACRRVWRPDRARLYIDFFHRHLTAGDVGAALSHLRVAEEAHAAAAPLTLVLEDDARLTPTAIPLVMEEVELLSRLKIDWDLIYLHSVDYGRRAEGAIHPSSRLRVAGHRKVCHAYVLSRRGACKLATCGFRQSLFPVDDFLPALHAGHPREDIMALPCVRRARGEPQPAASAGGRVRTTDAPGALSTAGTVAAPEAVVTAGEQHRNRASCDVATAAQGSSGLPGPSGFAAFTFADDAGLLDLPTEATAAAGSGGRTWPFGRENTLDSDSKAGSGSAVLLGDAEVLTICGEGETQRDAADAACGVGAPPRLQEPGGVVGVSRFRAAAPALPPAINFSELLAEGQRDGVCTKPCVHRESVHGEHGSQAVSGGGCSAELRRQLLERGYARLRLPPSWTADEAGVGNDLGDLVAAEGASTAFFHLPLGVKRRFAGRGGRKGELMLWSCGFSAWPQRQQWHVVCGGFDEAQPWPSLDGCGGGSDACGLHCTASQGDAARGYEAHGLTRDATPRLSEHKAAPLVHDTLGGCTNPAPLDPSRRTATLKSTVKNPGASPPASVGSGMSALQRPLEVTHAAAMRPALRRAEHVLRGCALACLSGPVLGDAGAVHEACAAVSCGDDPSVLDCFLYAPVAWVVVPPSGCGAAASVPAATPDAGMQMSEHFDPGLLTVTRRSNVPGLEVWDASTARWVALEAEAAPNDVLVLAGEQLHELSGGAVPSVRHRVVAPRTGAAERCSVVFELRLPESIVQRERARLDECLG